jgi:hypothetical protein
MHSSWLPNALLVYALLSGPVLGQNDTNPEDVNNPDENTGNNEDGNSGDTENSDFDTGINTPSVVPEDCHCGFLDPLNGRSYTDSLIVYFNETGELGDAFNVSSYEHAYEQGWGKYYREGALASNVYYENGSTWNISPGWLNLNVSAKTNKHLVNGAEIETKRQDMLYGSFRTLMRSAAPYAGGGSAFTMRLIHNESISAELELLSMDDSGVTAKYATSTNGEAPLPANSVNYTTLLGSEYNQSPWDFWEYRMDWDSENIEWFAGVNKTRTMPASNWTLPVSLSLKHWSLGLPGWTEGPPGNDSGAAVGWMRLFFNSSVTSPEDRPSNCSVEHFCSTEDEMLRLSTPFTAEMERLPADLLIKGKKSNETPSTAAIALAIASVVVTSILIIFGLSQKATSKKPAARPPLKSHQSDVELSRLKSSGYTRNSQYSSHERVVGRPAMGMHQSTISQDPLLGQYDSFAGSTATLGATPTPSESRDGLQYSSPIRGEPVGRQNDADHISPTQNNNVYSSDLHLRAGISGTSQSLQGTGTSMYPIDSRVYGVEVSDSATAVQSNAGLAGAVPGARDTVKGPTAAASPANPAQVPQQRTRVDYLAGLVALCSILVAATHFVLTFAPSTVMEYLDQHYKSEYWARRTIEPFFFNNIWTGLFFTTSTRFLTTGYLRKADLKIIAEKTVCRTPRFMIPIVAVILFEYFMMDVGATTYLEYLPSITWSPWPSTSVYPNFGWFINETLQLIYLIPNAAPQLTWNYCTGKQPPSTDPRSNSTHPNNPSRRPLDNPRPTPKLMARPPWRSHHNRNQNALEALQLLRLLHPQPLVRSLLGLLLLVRPTARRPRHNLQIPQNHSIPRLPALPAHNSRLTHSLLLPRQRPPLSLDRLLFLHERTRNTPGPLHGSPDSEDGFSWVPAIHRTQTQRSSRVRRSTIPRRNLRLGAKVLLHQTFPLPLPARLHHLPDPRPRLVVDRKPGVRVLRFHRPGILGKHPARGADKLLDALRDPAGCHAGH